jgi:hypothetical protein
MEYSEINRITRRDTSIDHGDGVLANSSLTSAEVRVGRLVAFR